jgi:hypothetical protein
MARWLERIVMGASWVAVVAGLLSCVLCSIAGFIVARG